MERNTEYFENKIEYLQQQRRWYRSRCEKMQKEIDELQEKVKKLEG